MSDHLQDRFDQATTRRLARLGQRAVDTTRLEQKLAAALEQEAQQRQRNAYRQTSRSTIPIVRWLRTTAAIAAILALGMGLLLAIDSGTPRASAAVLELSTLHRELVSGKLSVTPVASIEEANAQISAQQASAPALPAGFDQASVQSCCLVDVQGRLAAVAILKKDDALITLVVAQAPGFGHEMGTRIDIDGQRFFGHELNGVRMMMANRGDRWLCVMGDVSYEQLARLAADAEY